MAILLDVFIYALIGAGIGVFFSQVKKKEIIGGFWGGWFIGTIGAVLGGFLFRGLIQWVVETFMVISNVNTFAALLGGYLALFLYVKFTSGRERVL